MNVAKIAVDRAKARELYQAYKKHQHYSEPLDQEIQRTYQLIAQGRMVIQAFESIRLAGLNAERLPKLALCRADAKDCYWRTENLRGRFLADTSWPRGNMTSSKNIPFAWPMIRSDFPQGRAAVPLVPLHLRPKRGLSNYHILWEAEWTRIPPHDPFLLRRIGGDMWLVVAQWDLTEVERAALSTRLAS